ncbi:putative quinol monooxygenase [Homoserinibacter sp. YIM 151385]|uniref:putative quinol monooxygenase n=1 Tax=Homoserinibacter sp. YIM 151385 TaxID=2985506 RepID=UPI0022F01208|nr:putative quinol monooxygenase [Homoserinibacter sp. YIM 151385]WBU37307.1 putative quinol monooxygenase [Homoserinibacter sp. YIM 151385]
MTFVNVGTLGTLPGRRDELVALLTRPSVELRAAGCLRYDVGISDDEPDAVFVSELWESADHHRASLELASVRTAIAEARPLLSGEMSGLRFEVAGTPLDGGGIPQ